MNGTETAREWAESQFMGCQLGDWRRTERLVKIATAMMEAPGVSIPQQMKSTAGTKAAYRFLSDEGYQYEDLIAPHWAETRRMAGRERVVLMVHDLTTIDYSPYSEHIRGLGPVGDNHGQGFQTISVLSVVPGERRILGLAYQKPFFREAHDSGESRTERSKRAKESDVWKQAVEAIGPSPEGSLWVHVGDRGGDIYSFFEASQQAQSEFLVRVCQDRKMYDEQGEVNYLISFARQLAGLEERELDLPAKAGQAARTALLQIAFAPLTLSAGWMNRKSPPIKAWVVRVWEISTPPPGIDPIEWVLLTTVPTENLEQAWERVEWYRCRWLIEEFHMCLKTGCRIEFRRLEEASSLLRLLAILSPLAVQLLTLKVHARLHPDLPASTLFPIDLIRLVAHLSGRSDTDLSLHDFWRLVAMQGGFLGRKRDGQPGWQSLWHGWLFIQTLLRGARLNFIPAPF